MTETLSALYAILLKTFRFFNVWTNRYVLSDGRSLFSNSSFYRVFFCCADVLWSKHEAIASLQIFLRECNFLFSRIFLMINFFFRNFLTLYQRGFRVISWKIIQTFLCSNVYFFNVENFSIPTHKLKHVWHKGIDFFCNSPVFYELIASESTIEMFSTSMPNHPRNWAATLK